MTHNKKHKKTLNETKQMESPRQKVTGEGSRQQCNSDKDSAETELKNAHASGIGSLARSENQIENSDYNEFEKDKEVY
jgi:hypothetical protein